MHRQGPAAVVLDTDPGIDDAVALAFAARAPQIDLRAVTTTYGNAPLSVTTRNARYVLTLAGRTDVPVVPGSAGPLAGSFHGDPRRHGAEGLGHVVPDMPPVSETGSGRALLDVLAASDQLVTLVTLGPLTNLAHALLADDAAVRDRLRAHVAVLGAFATPDSPTPPADFNLGADRDAADVVLRAGLPTRLVPLDVTTQVRVLEHEIRATAAGSPALARMLGAALAFPGGPDRGIHDAVAVAGVVAPDVLDFTLRRLKIGEPGDPAGDGIRPDPQGVLLEVATSVRAAAVRRLLGRVIAVA